jgi:nitronate monooxygenase
MQGSTIWSSSRRPSADSVGLTSRGLHKHLGMEFVDVGDDWLRMRMPVDERTCQPFGRLHGGASVALAETVGSVAASYCIGDDQLAVGQEINANHVRPAYDGWVYCDRAARGDRPAQPRLVDPHRGRGRQARLHLALHRGDNSARAGLIRPENQRIGLPRAFAADKGRQAIAHRGRRPPMPFKTRITEMLGIEHPIVQGGMQSVGYAELASAVSNAGGLGTITGLTQPSPHALREEIERCRSMTSKPFAVNITVFPTILPPDYKGYAQAVIESGVKIIETAGTQEVREIWEMVKPHGITVLHKCTAVRHALSAEKHGCDIISIDGFECAGHPGEDDIPGLILIPAAADKVKIPMLASGGFGDGRGLVAALALGADGINMGTRFCATQEAPIHENVKAKYVENDERGTNLIFRRFKNTARVGKNEVSDKVVEISARPEATFEDIRPYVAGAVGRELLQTGDLSKGIFWAGMIQGLIHDIPTCQELMDRIIGEAEEIVKGRLGGMLA